MAKKKQNWTVLLESPFSKMQFAMKKGGHFMDETTAKQVAKGMKKKYPKKYYKTRAKKVSLLDRLLRGNI